MGRLDLPDVYRDEDYSWRYDDSSVDSPLMVREAGDSIALRTTEEPRKARLYCGAHMYVSLVSDGDQGECGTEFTVHMDDPECPTVWWPCPKCGCECEAEW